MTSKEATPVKPEQKKALKRPVSGIVLLLRVLWPLMIAVIAFGFFGSV